MYLLYIIKLCITKFEKRKTNNVHIRLSYKNNL